ncbi:membrane protein insertion efficiency factor YidD [Campylobacter sp. MIT 21-1685]|uniref:membrane protein insertion efficiency factor YidD n=1 Tax=unclassified Campylobacter TaxID=2593542 RepID=UPI00224A809C|nr:MULTISPECIES: membrane protein insertion efficiency factor YidD [unclassified Campylobacter]MCX2683096.1 membrane protein insertion efficiency factor YidD [Campylobacter sp. MIT 21-1684]MCX2751444.1 membrane protein insertion efficiency factor YidD [Campylobacter sp. MIT 21-1682]MCX2807644.1 membrane protein insertion efficiency factor YidD [Campylobacter sp. MIT 21-1685]
MFQIVCLSTLRFYQNFLSPLKPRTCRYYPSCSEYALWHFQKNTLFLAFFFTFLRIAKCNPLCKGGIDYPIVFKNLQTYTFCFNPLFLSKQKLCFFYIPLKNKSFYLVKIIL